MHVMAETEAVWWIYPAGIIGMISLLYLYLKVCVSPYQVLKMNGINGPTPSFFFGNYRDCKKVGILNYYKELKRIYGSVVGFYHGRKPQILVTDVELIKLVTIKDFKIFNNRPYIPSLSRERSISNGLIRARDEEWRCARRALSPLFTSLRTKSMAPVIQDSVRTLMTVLKEHVDADTSLEISKVYSAFTMETILATVFGRAIDIQRNQSDQLAEAAAAMFEGIQEGANSSVYLAVVILSNFPWIELLMKYLPLHNLKSFAAYSSLREVATVIIQQRKKECNMGKDLLQLMLEATIEVENVKKRLTDDQIVTHAVNFMLAGYETSSITLAYTSYLLALNPHIQEQLQSEIDSFLEQNTGVSMYQAAQDLEYLDMVLQESLRLYPPVPIIARECGRDYKYCGITIPKGCTVNCASYLLHMDPDLWTDPAKFDPMRFTADEKSKRPQNCFMPFGSGPHNCIGTRLALLTVKMALIEILRRFMFISAPETQVPLETTLGLSMAPKNGIHLRLVSRRKNIE